MSSTQNKGEREPLRPTHGTRSLKYDPILGNMESNTTTMGIQMPTTVYLSSKDVFADPSTARLRKFALAVIGVCFGAVFFMLASFKGALIPSEGAAWSSIALPLSYKNPEELGILALDRPWSSYPGAVFGKMASDLVPLPTNSWCENLFLGTSTTGKTNHVFQLPYIVGANGQIPGINAHATHVFANDRQVMVTFEEEDEVTFGAVEVFMPQHVVSQDKSLALGRLSTVLEWKSKSYNHTEGKIGSFMSSAIVRGNPYVDMKYVNARPRIKARRALSTKILIDNIPLNYLECGKDGEFSTVPVVSKKEVKITFDISDQTWLIFVSEPVTWECTVKAAALPDSSLPPGVVKSGNAGEASFEIRAVNPMRLGMIRGAMANNCTLGHNAQHCIRREARDNSEYMNLLRAHSDAYPTGRADIQFTFPVESTSEEELHFNFNWAHAYMSDLHKTNPLDPAPVAILPAHGIPAVEPLIFATPHHQERMLPSAVSTNKVYDVGCTPTIHGLCCPVVGGHWMLLEHLHPISFQAFQPPREEMRDAIIDALQTDIKYRLPDNYLRGAGDTYFSGKMLGRLARVLLIAEEVGGVTEEEFTEALEHLKQAVEIWYSPLAEAPLLYDRTWGGIVSCGCDYMTDEDNVGHCANRFPDCPALTDEGQNFGHGFYNDHHFHFGYHIFAAGVVAKFDREWGRKNYERSLVLVRDIANPSPDDPYFPTYRHKDWYLGFSWASGIVILGTGNPYPNGLNQESSSEAIAAYEGLALFGQAMAQAFEGSADIKDMQSRDDAVRIRDMGRLLLATEMRSAKTYWHVQDRSTPGVARIYPDVYAPKVVGMIWGMLAQEQTWFGNEQWKAYGIQLLPITPIAEQRDSISWVKEMYPYFEETCRLDHVCAEQGWSILVFCLQAELGDWSGAWKNLNTLNDTVYASAGGNGQSRSNSLWYIATRPQNVSWT